MRNPPHIRFRRIAGLFLSVLTVLALTTAVPAADSVARKLVLTPAGLDRNVIFVRVPGAGGSHRDLIDANQAGACWQDFAYLAAVPAGVKANCGSPAVIALDESCSLPREIRDYLRRYKPQRTYCLGTPVGIAGATIQPANDLTWPGMRLPAESAESAAWTLATTFWKSSDQVVLCDESDYASALTASSLAARLGCPLMFTNADGVSKATMSCLRYLGVKEAVLVGKPGKAAGVLTGAKIEPVELSDAKAVLTWLGRAEKPVTYLAVTNPNDRDKLVIRKLSLASALLAAGRGGIAVPLTYDAVWKVGFSGEECTGKLPKGTPASKKTPRTGKLTADGYQYAYVITSGRDEKFYTQINIDLNGNGNFADPGEGPFRGGDVVKLGKRRYMISLGIRNGIGKEDVRITTPCADKILGDLKGLYAAMGHPAKDVAIVAMPDGIPQAIVHESQGMYHDICSDFPFTNTDNDWFGEVAVGRVTAENATFATLYASRVLTYDDLLDATWENKVGMARWENTYGHLFENYGFVVAPHHDIDKLQWIRKPEGRKRGLREKGFGQDSPLASVAAIAHTAHSWWREIGQTYFWDSQVLLAPTVVQTGGCLSTALDREKDFHSVVSRMLRNGAAAYVGSTLPATACQEQQRLMFWNAVLAGESVGKAELDAENGVVAQSLLTGQKNGGPNHRMLYLRGLFGDPAFTMHVPSDPKVSPAHCTFDKAKGVVSVFGPGKWWPVQIRVPEDWKKWRDKPLYVLRGAGTWPNRHWINGPDYDAEETYVWAKLRTGRKVKSIRQIQSPRKPLGWTGKYVVNENPDGTRTYMWRVRIADFNQQTGKIISKADRLDYRVSFEPR